MRKILKNAAILTVIALVCGILLGLAHEVTAEPIEKARQAKTEKAYAAVIPGADTFKKDEGFDLDQARSILDANELVKVTVNDSIVAYSGSELQGYILTVTDSEGYGGDIQFTVGLDPEGKVTGISFLSISESPGLGMEAQDDPEWKTQYNGKSVEQFAVVKNGASADNEITAISGATITSKAVTNGVNGALIYYQNVLKGGGR